MLLRVLTPLLLLLLQLPLSKVGSATLVSTSG
jgi:hypothetical protein